MTSTAPAKLTSAARWIVAAVVTALVIASFIQARKPTAQLADFGAYYRAGQAVVADRSPYTLDAKFGALGAYMYCPAFAHLVCRPLAHLRYVGAMRAFLTVNWLATAAAVALSLRLLRTEPGRAGPRRAQPASRARPTDSPSAVDPTRIELRSPRAEDGPAPSSVSAHPLWVGLLALAAVGTYLWADLHNGQVGTLLLLACLGWLALTLADRPILGGVALSLAVGLKIYPLLLAPYLLLRRRWWPGLIGLAIGLLVQFVTPALFVGPRGLLPLHREWLQFCLQTQVPMQTFRAGNQSLLGVLARTPPVSDGVHLFSPSHLDQLQHAYPAIVLAVTAALYVLLWSRRTGDPVADVSLLLIWMTLASPRAWTFNFAAELPAAILLARAVVDQRRRWPLAAVALLAAVWAITFPTNSLPPQGGWSFGIQFLLDKHFVAAVLMATAVVVIPARVAAGPVGFPVRMVEKQFDTKMGSDV